MTRRSFTWNAYETSLTSPLLSGSPTAIVDSAVGLVAPVYLVIDPDDPLKREWVRVNTINGTSFENMVRNQEGSVGDIDHDAGAKVRAVFTKQHLDDIFLDLQEVEDGLVGPGGHIVDTADPHAPAGYLKLTTADGRYINKLGDVMQGILNMGNQTLTGLPAPRAGEDTDAVTKKYADDLASTGFSGLHADLTDVTESDHHTKYTNGDAVSAMGGENVNNPLNHPRFTDANAIAAVGPHFGGAHSDLSGVGASDHHSKYTDIEARAAVDNGTYLKLSGGTLSGGLGINGTIWVDTGNGIRHFEVIAGVAPDAHVHVRSSSTQGVPIEIERTGGSPASAMMRITSGGAEVLLTFEQLQKVALLP